MSTIKILLGWMALTGIFALYLVLMEIILPLAAILDYYIVEIL